MHRSGFTLLFVLSVIILTTWASCNKDNRETKNAEEKFTWIEWNNAGTDTTIYYVSVNGSDENNGTSVQTAFKTLSKALRRVRDGGKIRILPGTYSFSIVLENWKLTNGIAITGYQGMPVFDGKLNLPAGLFFDKCANIVIDSIKFINYTDFGIGGTYCQKIVFSNLVLRDNGHKAELKEWGEMDGFGLLIDESDEILIEGCEATLNGPDPKVFPDPLLGTGIDTYRLKNSIIRNNHSHHNIGGGILVEDCINVIVEGNEVNNNDLDASVDYWWDGGIWVDGGRDIFVRNNNFHNNMGPGIEISDEDNQNPTGYVLENNISTKNYFGILIWNFGTKDWPDTSIIKRINNDISGNTQKDVWIMP
ncbi:MAG: right-handed parallel beta-helix repeat-containing protein [Chlorobi bacterium]|nr:right-handed parallel beta-helix repeat-containing protein [Chlorobiota bacterium]